MSEKQQKKLTRVIEGPVRVKSSSGGSPLMYRGDDDNWYLQKELAESIPMSRGAFYARLKKLGPLHPDLLKPPNEFKQRHKPPVSNNDNFGDLAKLSNRSRRHNLAKIPPLSKFERHQGGI